MSHQGDLPLPSAGPVRPLGQPLSRVAGATLSEQLAQHFSERICQRLMAPGARLPSVRECARRHGVSPHTVVAAYDQLLARGLVEARRQRGFFVRDTWARLAAGSGSTVSPEFGEPAANTNPARAGLLTGPAPGTPPVDATALIRGMFQGLGELPAPGLGTLPVAWLDAPLLNGALRKVIAQGDPSLSLQYGHPAGDPRLRRVLALRLAEFGLRGVEPGQIVTANGATQALDLVSRTLLAPGDAVLVDEPGWAIEFARLTRLGMRLLPVPRGPEGPDLAVLETLAREHRPRLFVTVSVLHNPTGGSLSLGCAHQLLKLAEQYDFRIVEDDTYAHLAPAHLPRMAALDGLQRTLYISGFSKILAPGWRVGFVAGPPALVERLVDGKLLSGLTTPALMEQALAVCLEQGSLRRHAERVQARLDEARGRSVQLALAHGCRFITPPAGLFGWVDTGMDTETLAQLMHDQGWLLAPGHLFHATRRPGTLMRINFASSQDARFWQAFEAARESLKTR